MSTLRMPHSQVLLAALLLALPGLPRAAVAADFRVARNDNDARPGTAKKPFAALARARDHDAVRKQVAAGFDRNWQIQ